MLPFWFVWTVSPKCFLVVADSLPRPFDVRLALITKHGSSLGYSFSWPSPYHYGASSSIWFTTLSQSYRNPSSGKDVTPQHTHIWFYLKSLSKLSFVSLYFPFSRILWMVPIYSLDSVSRVLSKQGRRFVHWYHTDIPLRSVLSPVDCAKIPRYCNLCGHVPRVLWGLCNLQLHDLLT